LRHKVLYLGHVITSKGVKPDPDKIAAVKNFLKNPKNVKQFLSLASYYRRFIKDFSKFAKPLTDLLKKNASFIWTPLQEKAFIALRDELCKEPILQYPNFNEPFILTVDACGYAIGGVLSQGSIGKDLPITFTSRILNTAERNYSTIEKECLAIIYCIIYFRHYLYGRHFTILTDHRPLVTFHQRPKLSIMEMEAITFFFGKAGEMQLRIFWTLGGEVQCYVGLPPRQPTKTPAGGLPDRCEGTRGIAFAYLPEPPPVRRYFLRPNYKGGGGECLISYFSPPP
jgi:hypothetical protein